MRVCLIDIDSKIPNLALMKISAYHKRRGDQVGFNVENPDLTYVSVIYKKNKWKANGTSFFNGGRTIVGGSGYDLTNKLPKEIEFMRPDYDLYFDVNYSMGFSSRGCNRNCYFCIVPQKEGKFQRWQHPSGFHRDNFNKILFLDNNILWDKEWFFEVTDFCKGLDLSVWFTQGLDIRLVDIEVAQRLAELKAYKGWHFAFDFSSLEPVIREKVQLLNDVGLNLRHNVQFYVYVDDDSEYKDAVYRCKTLKELGTNPFVMFNIDREPTKRVKELQRWANRKWLFWGIKLEEYNRRVA